MVRVETTVGIIAVELANHVGDDKADRVLILNRLASIENHLSRWHGGMVAVGVVISAIWAAVGLGLFVLSWKFPT